MDPGDGEGLYSLFVVRALLEAVHVVEFLAHPNTRYISQDTKVAGQTKPCNKQNLQARLQHTVHAKSMKDFSSLSWYILVLAALPITAN